MRQFQADVPAYITLRFLARDEEHAREILKRFELVAHEFGDDCTESEVAGVLVSPAITIYSNGIDKRPEVQVALMDEGDDDGEDHCGRCCDVNEEVREKTCRECDGPNEDGEGFDGMCGGCADKAEPDECQTCADATETRAFPCDECGEVDEACA